MSIVDDLKKLGLTTGEAKVYAALLELGSSTVGPLVKRSRVAYSNIYDVLDRLMEKGLATFITKGKMKRFQAVEPVAIGDYLDKESASIDEQKTHLKNILPRIKALQETNPKQEAEIFIGFKGLMAAYERILGEPIPGEEYLFIYLHEGPWKEKADDFYTQLWKKYKNIPARGIGDKAFKKSEFVKKFSSIKYRFTDFPIFAQAEAYGDQMLIISWDEPIIVNLVRAKNLADNFRNYFESVWKEGKE